MQLQRLIFPEVPVYIPMYGDLVSAGFPSPAADYIESGIDLCRILFPTSHRHIHFASQEIQ